MTYMNLVKTKERNPYLSSSIFELNFSDVHALYTYLKQLCFLLLMQGIVETGHTIYRTSIMLKKLGNQIKFFNPEELRKMKSCKQYGMCLQALPI